jgi:TPR repeat protein
MLSSTIRFFYAQRSPLSLLLIFVCQSYADEARAIRAYNGGDFPGAFAEYMPLAKQGNADAQFMIGYMYAAGEGVPRNDDEAVKWYQAAAEQGNSAAQFNLGKKYEGHNDAEAAKWFHLAAEQGILPAAKRLGRLYLTGRGVPRDYDQAKGWLRRAAEGGDVASQYLLGFVYEILPQDIAGQNRDSKEGAKWFEMAANNGDAGAQSALGVMYLEGWRSP